jgi:hypothetical protein
MRPAFSLAIEASIVTSSPSRYSSRRGRQSERTSSTSVCNSASL